MSHSRDFDGFANLDSVLERAIKNDRRYAEYIWRDIAKGEIAFIEDRRWICHVAERVVRTLIDSEPEKRERAQLALQALGLAGRRNSDEELRHELVASQTFRNWDSAIDHEDGKCLSRTEIAQDFIKTGLLSPSSNLRAAAKKLDRREKKSSKTGE